MEQRSKKNIFLVITIIILSLICILYIVNSMKVESKKNVNNLSDNSDVLEDCEETFNDSYIYKAIVTNENGANVYNNYSFKNRSIVDTLEKGEEINVVADVIDINKYYLDNNRIESYETFENIRDYYYLVIDVCGKQKYLKYNDVSVIDSSIVLSNKFEKTERYYVHNDEYLLSGPGLSFEINDESKIIPKGTIVSVNTYSRIGNAVWLYVEGKKYNGWLLKELFNSVNYPYNNMKYGSAVLLDESEGYFSLDKETNLYKYAFSNSDDEVISIIPSGTRIKYDYSTSEPGIKHYHVKYNDVKGWIVVDD